MRTPVIAGNWKMFNKRTEALALVDALKPLVAGAAAEVVVAPVFTVLNAVAGALSGSNISLSAQDCFWEEEGAFTGEISPGMLKDAGCSHVIIGHSERRQYFGETDQTVNRKIGSALRAGLTPIFCIGETLEERESGRTMEVLKTQVTNGLAGIAAEDAARIIVAYEPVWAIGTGKTASNEQAQEAHAFIRGVLGDAYSADLSAATRILYGGSVKPENAAGLMQQPDIDGALVGGASLKADSFAGIVNCGR